MKNHFSYIKEKKFYLIVDNLFIKIENILNIYNNSVDIDYLIENYVFKITFLNKSVIIINRQISLQQIWLATTINGYRFHYKNDDWICNRSREKFWKIFHKACCIQSNTNLPYV